MPRKEAKFKDGNKTMTVVIDDAPPLGAQAESAPDVEAYQQLTSETFSIINPEGRILTITIAE
jgi:hypothetical protein